MHSFKVGGNKCKTLACRIQDSIISASLVNNEDLTLCPISYRFLFEATGLVISPYISECRFFPSSPTVVSLSHRHTLKKDLRDSNNFGKKKVKQNPKLDSLIFIKKSLYRFSKPCYQFIAYFACKL
jgi:hypothetical protein